MWKCEHDTVINGEPLHAEGIGENAKEILKQMKDDLKVTSPGALSLIRKTIQGIINQGGGEFHEDEDHLVVYQLPDEPDPE